MRHERPTWVQRLIDAHAAALAALTLDERAARAASIAARGERLARRASERRERRASKLALIGEIATRLDAGETPTEVAEATGIAVRTLRRLSDRWGFALVERKGFRLLRSWVRDDRMPALDCLAADLGVTRAAALEAILDAALEQGAHVARRTLGVQRPRIAA